MELIFLKFIRFAVVGLIGMSVDFSSTFLAKERCRLNKYLANTIGFVLAVCINYVLNRYWTFQSQNNAIAVEFIYFILISTLGLALNSAILWLCHDKRHLPFYLSKIIAIGITVLWNFSGNYLFTFSSG